MKRNKKPRGKDDQVNEISDKKRKLKKIIEQMSANWNADERETSILFEHHSDVVHFETSHPATARKWLAHLWGDIDVTFDHRSDSFRVSVPLSYCRGPELILKSKYRK